MCKWIKSGSTYRQTGGGNTVDTLDPGIYQVECAPMSGWYLERTGDKFVFDYKVYGVHTEIIERILKVYPHLTGNMGILFNGLKGTGKTVTAKILANQLNLPVIIVKSFGNNNTDLVEFLSSINCDCILFFDEFEKQFKESDYSILQIMDGVYTSEFRRVFLLTTNSTNINENMLSRPSRIRYMKEFGNLELAVVTEYLNDNLVDQTRKADLVDYLDTLVFSTIDILKSIVEEVNIIGFDEFIRTRDDFNVKLAKYDYQVVRINCSRDLMADTKQLSQLVADFKTVLGIYTEYYSIPPDVYTEKIRPLQEKWKSYPEKRCVYNQNKLDTLKIGDRFGHYDSEHVVYMDLGQNIVITSDHDDGEMAIYFVLNPKAKASLYSQPKTLVL
jgi:broad-specificity NMP kinase